MLHDVFCFSSFLSFFFKENICTGKIIQTLFYCIENAMELAVNKQKILPIGPVGYK